jgi:hypothetical protein
MSVNLYQTSWDLSQEDNIHHSLVMTRGETLRSEIHKLNNSVWNKEEFPDQWKQSYYCTNSQEG